MEDDDITIIPKIILIGDINVGKTALMRRFITKQFEEIIQGTEDS